MFGDGGIDDFGIDGIQAMDDAVDECLDGELIDASGTSLGCLEGR